MELPESEINVFHGTGDNPHLSNLALRPFNLKIRGVERRFQTVEGAFQASKLEFLSDPTDAEGLIRELTACTGTRARQLGRAFRGLDTVAWDLVSEGLMYRLVFESFAQNPDARDGLLATGQARLTHRKQGVEQDAGRFSRVLTRVRDDLRRQAPEATQ